MELLQTCSTVIKFKVFLRTSSVDSNHCIRCLLCVVHYTTEIVDGAVFQTEAALMFDAVYVLASALQKADVGTPLRPVNLSCEGGQAWAFGSSLYNYLNLVGVF